MNITKLELEKIIKKYNTKADILRYFNYPPNRGYYKQLDKLLNKYNIVLNVKISNVEFLRNTIYKLSNNQLKDIINSSLSKKEIAEKLINSKIQGKMSGSYYRTINDLLYKLNIDINKFKNLSYSRSFGVENSKYKKAENYLKKDFITNSTRLKQKLIYENLLDNKCNKCKLNKWFNSNIPLELHHKDGDISNNLLSNLEILCPNCHALTKNYKNNSRRLMDKPLVS